jgi:murein DD-endopeptidase MepM/ murein hydrolase activator NlpD
MASSGGHVFGSILNLSHSLFPERQILVKSGGRVSYVTLSYRVQMAIAAAGVSTLALLGYTTSQTFIVGHHSVDAHLDADRSSSPNVDLEALVAQLQQQLAEANASGTQKQLNGSVEEARAQIRALEQARDKAVHERQELEQQLNATQQTADTNAQHVAQLGKTLETNRNEARQSDSQRASLQNRIHALESELASANAHGTQYQADLDGMGSKLQQLTNDREKIVAERDRLQARIAKLESAAATSSTRNAANAGSAATATAAPAPSPQNAAGAPEQRSQEEMGEFERLIASTGIDVQKLLDRLGSRPVGQGGPYLALDQRSSPSAADTQRAGELEQIAKTLPLAQPLVEFRVESPFGARRDPFTRRAAFHSGLDLVAPYRSPVYSTAPGVVKFTGVKGKYGKVVEIDHGHGIVTRFAHLHKIVVARGQTVSVHQQVGELGSTGRSTGPHLHYEVMVQGTPLDPVKFLKAGKNVLQANSKD